MWWKFGKPLSWTGQAAIAHRSVSSLGKEDTTRREMPMARPRMDLTTFVGKLLEEQDGDVLPELPGVARICPDSRGCVT